MNQACSKEFYASRIAYYSKKNSAKDKQMLVEAPGSADPLEKVGSEPEDRSRSLEFEQLENETEEVHTPSCEQLV